MYKKSAESDIWRLTVNLPKKLVKEARSLVRGTVTDTLIEGLQMVKRRGAYDKLMALKGKIHLDIDLDESRERRRR